MSDNHEKSNQDLLAQYQHTASAGIDDAVSLPFATYIDPGIYALEKDAIFRNEWVFICTEQELSATGDYFTFELVGEKLAVLRGKDKSLRALSNICRHRGTPLLNDGFGNLSTSIVCPYHGWAYDDEGSLKAAPMTGNITVDKERHCLPQFALESWHGLLFINLADEPSSFAERMQGIDDYLVNFDLSTFTYAHQGEVEYWESNWKLAIENAMESYHLFKVHKNTLEPVTPTKNAYYLAGSSEWTITGGELVDNSNKFMKFLRGNYPEAFKHCLVISLPPSFVGVLTYDSFSWIQVLPLDAGHSRIRSGAISPHKPGYEDKKSAQLTADFFAEDKAICERVHSGMGGTLSQGGKLVELERVVVDFHQFLASRLFGSPVDDFFFTSMSDVFTQDS